MLDKAYNFAARTVSGTDIDEFPIETVTRIDWSVKTGIVCTTSDPVVDPAGTVTLAGTEATPGKVLQSAMIEPPFGAGAANLKLKLTPVPPGTEGAATPTDTIVLATT